MSDADEAPEAQGPSGPPVAPTTERSWYNLLDPLLPEGLRHAEHREQVRARLILEGANRPVTPEADDILATRGIPVLPDILANAGGVTVSFFEWVQNIEHHSWPLAEIHQRMRERIVDAVDRVVTRWRSFPSDCEGQDLCMDLRTAALTEALERIVRVTGQRGIWP
jgi:glutamate dehydrogenase (NAD(P)+)